VKGATHAIRPVSLAQCSYNICSKLVTVISLQLEHSLQYNTTDSDDGVAYHQTCIWPLLYSSPNFTTQFPKTLINITRPVLSWSAKLQISDRPVTRFQYFPFQFETLVLFFFLEAYRSLLLFYSIYILALLLCLIPVKLIPELKTGKDNNNDHDDNDRNNNGRCNF